MAPKQIENPPLVSSSEEEEEEESGSSGEESESSGEDSKKNESSDDEGDEQSKPIQTSVAPKKPESESDGESDSDSDPDPEPVKKQPPVVTKQKAESSKSAVNLPESSTAKRPLNKAEDEAKKKMKISISEHAKKPAKEEEVKKISGEEAKKISGEEAKKMFQRLFSETDEIALLQGILDFTGDISEDMDGFCNYVKKLITFNATKSQIATKIQRLKKKFVNTVKKSLKKGKDEDEIKFSKDLDQKAFDLSRSIWGTKGVLASKSRKKTPKEIKIAPKEMKLAPKAHSPKKQVEMGNNTLSREIARFFKADNVSVLGLDETTVTAGWDMIADGPKKREMEEKFKKLKAKQAELCLQRTTLVDNAAKMIFKSIA